MGKSTLSGPVRSQNGFQHVAKNSTTGLHTVHNLAGGGDSRRYTLEERFKKRPALNAVIAEPYDNADATNASNTAITTARVIANKDFEVLGTSMTTALCTFNAVTGGIVLTTATSDEDQAILVPHLDSTQTSWTDTVWPTEQSLRWQAVISTTAIDNQKLWAGLKLTSDQLVATDADQAYFKFQTDATNSEAFTDYTLLHFVYSVANTDYITALPITVAANTVYDLVIDIDSNRQATIWVNGVQYNIANTAGSTGGTAATSVRPGTAVTRSNALTAVDLIPCIGIEAGAGAAEAVEVHYEGISVLIS